MSERLTLQDLVDLLSEEQGITKKDAEVFIRELVDLTSDTIAQKDFVRIKDFGTFKLTPVKARKSVDVNTGEAIEISAHYKLSFTPDKVLREAVNRPFAHFESILVEEDVVFEDKAQEKPKKKEDPKPKEESKEPIVAVEPLVEAVEPSPVVEEKEVVVEVADIIEEPVEIIESETVSVVEKVLEVEKVTVVDTSDKQIVLEKQQEDGVQSEIVDQIEEKVESVEEIPVSLSDQDESPIVEEKEQTISVRHEEEDDDDWEDSYYEEEARKKRNIRIGVGVLVVLLLVVGYWMFSGTDKPDKMEVAVEQNNSSITISDNEEDSTQNAEATSVEASSTEQSTAQDTPQQTEEPAITKPTTKEQGVKEVEIEAGQTMRMLGEKYYGHRAFWVYIFEENRSVISRPDAIQAGMKIVIPAASKYEIDANDKTSIRKAVRLETKLFSEFSEE